MVLSNAERQARHRARVKALLKSAVTPDDVLEAARLIYAEHSRTEPDAKPWPEFAASFTGKRRHLWGQWVPDSLDPQDYPDDLTPDELAICLKVAAVARAVRFPPD